MKTETRSETTATRAGYWFTVAVLTPVFVLAAAYAGVQDFYKQLWKHRP